MFNSEFYPTPQEVIAQMFYGYSFRNKVVLEPSAGRGDIVDALKIEQVKDVLTCEKNDDLAKIVKAKSAFLKPNFFDVTSEEISHIDFIVMNPPFSNAWEHILHAWNIAPKGCTVIALMNSETLRNLYSERRRELKNIIEVYGSYEELGECFKDADRATNVQISLCRLVKPSDNYETEFNGFFLDEEEEPQGNGIMSYNFVRDIVNRYVGAVKIFDKQLDAAVEMNTLTSSFYSSSIALSIREGDREHTKESYKKDLQKNAWKFIINKMDLNKFATRGVREDINKFVEQQTQVPFTMRNIYNMIAIVLGTKEQRMDRAIIEIFDKITYHHAENRHNVKGWKTNSHFLIGKKFILPYCISPAKEYGYTSEYYYSLKIYEFIDDFEKTLSFICGKNWDEIQGVEDTIKAKGKQCLYGEWFESEFFKFKGFKNGNMHFEFRDENEWGIFNQRVSKIKGFPLFEYKEQTKYQKRQTGRKECPNDYDKQVLFTF